MPQSEEEKSVCTQTQDEVRRQERGLYCPLIGLIRQDGASEDHMMEGDNPNTEMWTAWLCGLKASQQTVVALGLIVAGLIRPDPIINTSFHHLSGDIYIYKKKESK